MIEKLKCYAIENGFVRIATYADDEALGFYNALDFKPEKNKELEAWLKSKVTFYTGAQFWTLNTENV